MIGPWCTKYELKAFVGKKIHPIFWSGLYRHDIKSSFIHSMTLSKNKSQAQIFAIYAESNWKIQFDLRLESSKAVIVQKTYWS